jgi:16S rRNA (guanine1207-N2)-methyltransferase
LQDHYFSAKPAAKHDIRQFRAVLRGKEFTFVTDAGVFSKDHIDNGTELLINKAPLSGAKKVADLGCGYGPIGVAAAAFMSEAEVYLIDPNERAVELAARNIRLNGIRNAYALCGSGLEAVQGHMFDLILTNPPIRAGKEVIYELFRQSWAQLNPGGRLIIVIRTNQGAKSAAKYLEELFGEVSEIEKGSGFRLYQAVKQH